MATVIDSLVVMLGIDGSQFKKGSDQAIASADKMRKEAEKTAKDMQSEGKKASEFFSKVRNEALMFFGVFTAGRGLKNFAEDNLHNAASLGRLADNLELSVEELSSFQRASERAGGSAAGITAQLQESQAAVSKFKTGMSDDSMLWFYNLGGSEKSFKDAKEYLLARADIIAETNKVDPGRAQLQAQQMGISPEQFNLLKQGRVAVLALVEAQEKNSRFTRKNSEDAAIFENRMRDLKDRLAVTGTTILIGLMPAFEKMAVWLEKLADYFAAHKDDIADWLNSAISLIGSLVSVLDQGIEAIGGWKVVLTALLALKVAAWATSLLALGTGLMSVSAGLMSITGAGGAALAILGKLGLVGAAGAAGWAAGSAINKLTENTEFHDKLGEVIARTMASFGNEDAAESVARRTGKNDYSAYYKPGDKNKQQAVAAASPAQTKESAAATVDVAKKLMSMGWTSAQAAGIAGSLNQESGLDPNAKNAKSGAFGIAQWLGSRTKDFEKWAGKPLQGSSLDDQLRFHQYELTQGKEQAAGDRLRRATTPEEAAAIHSKYYERPGDAEANIPRRQLMATNTLAQLYKENSQAAASVPTQVASASTRTTNQTTSTSSNETNINGNIIVQTNATDANGIAKDIGKSIQRFSYTDQANTGMT